MADSASESDSSSVDGGMLIPSSPASREQFQKRIESLQQENRVLKMELDTFRLRVKNLQEENKALRQASVNIQAKAEQEEEFISNTLLKQIKTLKKEKETLALNYEQEEECLTNDLSRKLNQCRISVPLFKEGHCHKMQRLRDNAAESNQKQNHPQESRKLVIGRHIRTLEHAFQCRDTDCSVIFCRKMKQTVSHLKACRGRYNCTICRHVLVLIMYHSKNCHETVCPLPFCLMIKSKLKAHRQISKRGAATTQNQGESEAIGQSSPGSSSQPSMNNEPLALPDVPRAGMEMKPSACPRVMTTQNNATVFQQLHTTTFRKSLNFCQRLTALRQRWGRPRPHRVIREGTVIDPPQFPPGSPQGRAWQQHQQRIAEQRRLMLAKLRQQLEQIDLSPQPPM